MNKINNTIPSFQIDHNTLTPGIYVSRVDSVNLYDIVTYDIRICTPNKEMMSPDAVHTLEHICAVWLRNESEIKDKLIYFGPMGCMTGFYLILPCYWNKQVGVPPYNNDLLCEVKKAMIGAMEEVLTCTTIPGATQKECGNYKFHNLKGAKEIAENFLKVLK